MRLKRVRRQFCSAYCALTNKAAHTATHTHTHTHTQIRSCIRSCRTDKQQQGLGNKGLKGKGREQTDVQARSEAVGIAGACDRAHLDGPRGPDIVEDEVHEHVCAFAAEMVAFRAADAPAAVAPRSDSPGSARTLSPPPGFASGDCQWERLCAHCARLLFLRVPFAPTERNGAAMQPQARSLLYPNTTLHAFGCHCVTVPTYCPAHALF
jgi:hypothetical protein